MRLQRLRPHFCGGNRLLAEMHNWCIVLLALAAGALPAAAQTPDGTPPPQPPGAAADGTPASPSPSSPAGAARRTFEARCARCHQGPAADGLPPSGALGAILSPMVLARDSHYVRPGSPDTSRLFGAVLDPRHGQNSLRRDKDVPRKPAAADIEAVYAWIGKLPAAPEDCRPAHPPEPAAISRAVLAHLSAIGSDTAKDTRFVTLVHLARGCRNTAGLFIYRQTVDKILNSLSWRESLIRSRPVAGADHVLAISLDALGWTGAQWEALSALQPPGLLEPLPPEAAAATGTPQPMVRGDWLAAVAMRPPVYYDLLGIPGTLRELEQRLGIGEIPTEDPPAGVRAHIRLSRVTAGPRSAGRRMTWFGPAWFAEDHAAGADGPGGRSASPPENRPPAGRRLIFTLPNGFPAFAVYSPDGRRRTRVDVDIDTPVLADFGPTFAGRGCMVCHRSGLLPFGRNNNNGERSETLPSGAVPPAAPPASPVFKEGWEFYRTAMVRAGLDPDVSAGGLEPVQALAREYLKDADMGRLAAELGTTPEDLAGRLDTLPADRPEAVRRLAVRLRQQGTLPRDGTNTLLAALAAGAAAAPGPPAVTGGPQDGSAILLDLRADKTVYRRGDEPRFTIESSATCHLTFINVDQNGKARVLFPNDFERDTLLLGGRTLEIPAPAAPYGLRFTETGRETFVAVCLPGAGAPAGIEHRFAQRRFTSLGDWPKFLGKAAAEPEQRKILRAHRRRRSQPARGAGSPEGKESTGTAAPAAAGRAAVVVEIRG